MRTQLLLTSFLLIGLTSFAQMKKDYIIKPGELLSDVITKQDIYEYPKFMTGNVIFKDGVAATASLNYNSYNGEMDFIDPKGDTLALDNANTIKWITIDKDTFYHQQGYLKQLESTDNLKLATRQYFKLTNQQKMGAYDQPTHAAAETFSGMTNATRFIDFVVRERTTMTKITEYYIGDKFNHFMPVSKKNVLKQFAKQSNIVDKYISENNINFAKEEDIQKLFNFLKTV
jgi:hypothetical protein